MNPGAALLPWWKRALVQRLLRVESGHYANVWNGWTQSQGAVQIERWMPAMCPCVHRR